MVIKKQKHIPIRFKKLKGTNYRNVPDVVSEYSSGDESFIGDPADRGWASNKEKLEHKRRNEEFPGGDGGGRDDSEPCTVIGVTKNPMVALLRDAGFTIESECPSISSMTQEMLDVIDNARRSQ